MMMSSDKEMPLEDTGSHRQSGSEELSRKVAASAVPHQTVAERVKRGKAARKGCPRSAHAVWDPSADRPDPVAILEAQATTRIPELVPIRYERMLVSPFAFYRGAAAIMAYDLSTVPNTGLTVQLCGDAHLSNIGGFASPERDLILDVNDFDETLPGPWEWDVKRLVTSVEIAGREMGFRPKDLRKVVLATADEYHRSMKEFAAKGNLEMWYLHLDLAGLKKRWGKKARLKAVKAIEADLAHASHKDNHRALEKLTRRVNGEIRIASNAPLVIPVEDLAAGMDQEPIVRTLREFLRKYRMSLRGDYQHLYDDYRFTHLARKVVGVGSVGMRAWVVLMLGRDESDPLFLQVKEAQPSVLEPYLGMSVYSNNGRRVVEGQWLMQSSSDIFLGWDRIEGMDGVVRDYYVRQLWDWKVSADIGTMDPDELTVYARMCAWTLARAHARSGDEVAISSYLGKSDHVDGALAEFAVAYADQNERDYQALVDAAKSGRIKAATSS